MQPLSEILRPKELEDFVGQEHLVGPDGPIYKALQKKTIYSMIFWGTPGCGKTTLARLIANKLDAHFIEISPTTAGVKDIREIVDKSRTLFYSNQPSLASANNSLPFGEPNGKRTVLFVDEIHRFNKAQQDYLLPHVENGTLTLIGATTENPSFEIVSPLLSRCKVYVFNSIKPEDIHKIIHKTLEYFKTAQIEFTLTDDAKEFLVQTSNGDARSVLNTIDALVMIGVTNADKKSIQEVLQKSFNLYDKKGDEHYNTISAFIKSMRASDPDASLYYLARMVEAGEDPKFIARRMVIFASEDIGLADKDALSIANAVFRSCEIIGYPECQINLAHGAAYLAKAPKSRSSYDAYFRALKDVKNLGSLSIPLHIRNSPTKLMEDMGYGKGYEMYPQGKSYLPEKIIGKRYLK